MPPKQNTNKRVVAQLEGSISIDSDAFSPHDSEGEESLPPKIGKYAVVRRIGSGSFGDVFLAKDQVLDRDVAIKVPRIDPLRESVDIDKYFEEARTASSLGEMISNIVPVYDVGRDVIAGVETCFVVSQYIDGMDLEQVIETERPSAIRSADIIQKLARAVYVAHRCGILHRDIKPANILLDKSGTPFLADFGIALTPKSRQTATGFAGSPAYMSPEQATGTVEDLDHRSDVFSLGAVLFTLLSGERPFDGDDEADLFRNIRDEHVRPSELDDAVPSELRRICLRALEKNRKDRYATALELANDLAGFLDRATAGDVYSQRHAELLIQRLFDADVEKIPDLLKQLDDFRQWADPLLRELSELGDRPSDLDTRACKAALALLPVEPSLIGRVVWQLGLLDFEDHDWYLAMSGCLSRSPEPVAPAVWQLTQIYKPGNSDQNVRLVSRFLGRTLEEHCDGVQPNILHDAHCGVGSLLAKASFLAQHDSENPNWDWLAPSVVLTLLHFRINSAEHGFRASDFWVQQLQPVKGKLFPIVAQSFRSYSDLRDFLASFVVSFSSSAVEAADVLLDNININLPDELNDTALVPFLEQEVASKANKPATDYERLWGSRRRSSAARFLLSMGHPEEAFPIMEKSPDANSRLLFLMAWQHWVLSNRHSFGFHIEDVILKWSQAQPDQHIRASILSLLARWQPDPFQASCGCYLPWWDPATEDEGGEVKERLVAQISNAFVSDESGFVHGVAIWLLKAIFGRVDDPLSIEPDSSANWSKAAGHTLIRIDGPVTFLMGSPSTEIGHEENEVQHEKTIGHSFEVAATPVTVEQFLRFRNSHEYDKHVSPSTDSPINSVTWHDAAAYCNWISREDGLPEEEWCYVTREGDEFNLAPAFLTRTGYRLPTESEWEYCCRADGMNSRFYGDEDYFLPQYAWFVRNTLGNQMARVGMLPPNDFGFFDMLGNCGEWCIDMMGDYPNEAGLAELQTRDDRPRVIRGGGFWMPAHYQRCARRFDAEPTVSHYSIGFRVARTLK